MKQLINKDRFNQKIPHGLIIGSPDSGINFVAEMEITELLKEEKMQVIIIDAKGDYAGFCKQNGRVVEFETETNPILDPLAEDATEFTFEDERIHYLSIKSDFLIALCSVLLGHALAPQQKAFISRCIFKYNPTSLREFAYILEENIDNVLERDVAIYTEILKSSSYFSSKKPDEINNNLISFDLSALGKNMLTQCAYLLTLQHCFNIIRDNQEKGLKTVVYLTSPWILTENQETCYILNKIIKCSRRFAGAVTLVENFTSSFFTNECAKYLLNNVGHICALKMPPYECQEFGKMFGLEEDEMNAFKAGKAIVIDHKNTHIILDYDL